MFKYYHITTGNQTGSAAQIHGQKDNAFVTKDMAVKSCQCLTTLLHSHMTQP